MKTLVVIAHPDDEVIFLGGVLMALVQAGHHVDVVSVTGDFGDVALTRARRSEFRRAARRLGTNTLTLDLADGPGRLEVGTIADRLRRLIDVTAYDEFYTHGVWGEYGHGHHIDVCTAVHRVVGQVSGGQTWSLAGPLPYERSLHADVAQKRRLVQDLYPSQAFAAAWCSAEERLTRLDVRMVEILRLIAGAPWDEEYSGAISNLAREQLDTLASAWRGLEPTPPFPELASIPSAIWEPVLTLWRARLMAVLSSYRLDEELGLARAHATRRLRATGEEGP